MSSISLYSRRSNALVGISGMFIRLETVTGLVEFDPDLHVGDGVRGHH